MPAFPDSFVESVAKGKLLQGGRPTRHGRRGKIKEGRDREKRT